MKKTDEEIQALSSSFYRTGRRDDGLYHHIRVPTVGWWINQVIASGGFFTTPNVLGAWQVPLDAKGVILSCAIQGTAVGQYVHVCEGTRNPTSGNDMPLGAVETIGNWHRSWAVSLFGITALVPDGTIRFGAFGPGGNVTVLASPIGYIA